jgi:hypothetical protein
VVLGKRGPASRNTALAIGKIQSAIQILAAVSDVNRSHGDALIKQMTAHWSDAKLITHIITQWINAKVLMTSGSWRSESLRRNCAPSHLTRRLQLDELHDEGRDRAGRQHPMLLETVMRSAPRSLGGGEQSSGAEASLRPPAAENLDAIIATVLDGWGMPDAHP